MSLSETMARTGKHDGLGGYNNHTEPIEHTSSLLPPKDATMVQRLPEPRSRRKNGRRVLDYFTRPKFVGALDECRASSLMTDSQWLGRSHIVRILVS